MQNRNDLDVTCINTIRTLSMDAVQAANSGHPGTPMAMAPVAYCLWQQFLRFDPQDPVWPNRDRRRGGCLGRRGPAPRTSLRSWTGWGATSS